MKNEELIEKALEATKNSYSPMSNFKVGAALLVKNSDKTYFGCNIENSSYSLTNCAERTAFFKAISDGYKEFEAIAIMGSSDDSFSDFCSPCGACRQVMNEFCEDDFKIILGRFSGEEKHLEIKEYKLKELLPDAFKF